MRGHLGLDRLRQRLPSALAQYGQRRVVRKACSWSGQTDNAILPPDAPFPVTSNITENTLPLTSAIAPSRGN